MINYFWGAMIIFSILIALFSEGGGGLTGAIFSAAENGVSVALGLISILTFWLGIMKIIERSGLLNEITRLMRPLIKVLFPGLPPNHPAANAILMNMAANMLGMGNAATPFGIKAMEELQTLNPQPDVATDSMCTFLVINTSCITLIPTTVIALRAATGSANPAEIVVSTVAATAVSTGVALIADRIVRKLGKGHSR